MACLAISLQPANGPDILLQTRSWFPVSRALAAVSAFRLARLHLARGKQHPSSSSASASATLDAIGDDPLATGSGQLVVGVESQYRVVYRLVNSIYVLGVTTASDHASPAVHAFAVADAVNQAVSVVVAACRGVDVTPEKIHRKYPEVYLALDLVLHGIGSVRLSQILATIHGDNLARMVNSSPDAEARARGADSWPVVEHLAQDAMVKHIKHNAQLFILLSMVLLSCLVSSAVQGQSIADKGSNSASIRPNDDPDCEKEKLQWPRRAQYYCNYFAYTGPCYDDYTVCRAHCP